MNPNPVCVEETANFKKVKDLMKKYNISSFLVTAEKKPEDSPRLGKANKKVISGILTQRDINCFQFEDELVKNKMTSLDKLVYYEVDGDFNPSNCDLNPILKKCKELLIGNKIEKVPVINSTK